MKAVEPTSGHEPAAMDREPDFDALETLLRTDGPAPAIERLIETLEARKEYRALLDALLLKARHELGLPLIQAGPISSLPGADPHAVRGDGTSRPSAGSGRSCSRPARSPRPGPTSAPSPSPSPSPAALESYMPGDDAERRRPDHRRRLQSGGEHPARVRADPRSLRHLLGDHGPGAGPAGRRRRPEVRASSG